MYFLENERKSNERASNVIKNKSLGTQKQSIS
jgi:hypothetical protein